MDSKLLDILQHSLGVDRYGRGVQYRNHYCAGGDDVALCREMVARGYMKEHPGSALTGGSPLFTVTEDGKTFVREHSPEPPKQTAGQIRYEAYLKADSGMSFIRWLKSSAARRRERDLE
jgi:hypothetical protein